MNLFSLLLKIGDDILHKPNSTAAQITNFALKNPDLVKQGANFIGNVVGLTFMPFIFFSKVIVDREIRTNYNNWKKSPNTSEKIRQKEAFKKMTSSYIGSRIKKEIPIDIGLERGFISRDNPNETIIGVFENGEIRYAEKASYDSIDPELDRELNKKKLVLT